MTIPQFLDGSKTVTRRLGWKSLRVGDELIAVEKCMGLKRGEKQVEMGRLVVESVSRESLDKIDLAEVAREGFPDMFRLEFIKMFCRANGCKRWDEVTRIEFRRVDQRSEGEASNG